MIDGSTKRRLNRNRAAVAAADGMDGYQGVEVTRRYVPGAGADFEVASVGVGGLAETMRYPKSWAGGRDDVGLGSGSLSSRMVPRGCLGWSLRTRDWVSTEVAG